MKHIIILGDGMADWPVESLGGKTLMQYAKTPYMDKLASMGRTGRLKTVADGFHPGSEVANMSVLGYDLPKVYEGRGPLEAASIGVDLKPGEMAMRHACRKEERYNTSKSPCRPARCRGRSPALCS